MLKSKALFFLKELGGNDFRASDGWLDRWKKRKNVSFKTISGIFTYIFYVLDLKISTNSDIPLNIKIHGIFMPLSST